MKNPVSDNPKKASPVTPVNVRRVLRGRDWDNTPDTLESAKRFNYYAPSYRYSSRISFRVVRNIPKSKK